MAVDWSSIARDAVTGHHALQKPAELAGLLELVAPMGPKLVVEIGSDQGGTLWAWSQLGADVVSVTLVGGPYSSGLSRERQLLYRHGANVIVGNSHELTTWTSLHDLLGDRQADMLFIDGDHTYEGVCRDLMVYSPLVRPGGVVVLHDICRHPGKPDVGAWRVWETLREWPTFEALEIISEPRTWGGIGILRK
jgi:cephalosporin hydroxylase